MALFSPRIGFVGWLAGMAKGDIALVSQMSDDSECRTLNPGTLDAQLRILSSRGPAP